MFESTSSSTPAHEARALPPLELFTLPRVRQALGQIPMQVALIADRRVAYTNASDLPLGALVSGWSLTVALRGEHVRDGFVLIRVDATSRLRLRGHLAPLRGEGDAISAVVMAVDDISVERGRVSSGTGEDAAAGALGPLTPREREVFRLIARGARTREVGARLGITAKTVETHRTSIHRKLGLKCLADVMRLASSVLPAGAIAVL